MYNLLAGHLGQEEDPKTQNYDFFVANLVTFIIHIILRGEITE